MMIDDLLIYPCVRSVHASPNHTRILNPLTVSFTQLGHGDGETPAVQVFAIFTVTCEMELSRNQIPKPLRTSMLVRKMIIT